MSATVISASTRVLGSIQAAGDLVVEGSVDGSVEAEGQLTLGRDARVGGTITAHDVRIACVLERAISAEGVIQLLSTAEVRGDLEAARVIIDDGALFEGQVKLRRAPAQVRAPAPAPRVANPVPASAPERLVPELSSPGRRRLQRRSP